MSRPSVESPGAGSVRERPTGGDIPILEHPGWAGEFPWLAQGVTAAPFDLRMFGGTGRDVSARWERLRRGLGFGSVVHARQVHGSESLVHGSARAGVQAGFVGDGHLTATPGLLLTVSVADCVPVYLVDPRRRVVGLLHAGWRGVAGGVLPRAVERMGERWGVDPEALRLHLGPAICGGCYEVGPEVHVALGLDEPSGPLPVDLRALLLRQASAAGIDGASTSVSEWCTRCEPERFFSHRAGSAGRQVGFLGIRDAERRDAERRDPERREAVAGGER